MNSPEDFKHREVFHALSQSIEIPELSLLTQYPLFTDTALLSSKFARIGARFQIVNRQDRRFRRWNGRLSLDIQHDQRETISIVFMD